MVMIMLIMMVEANRSWMMIDDGDDDVDVMMMLMMMFFRCWCSYMQAHHAITLPWLAKDLHIPDNTIPDLAYVNSRGKLVCAHN